MAEKVQKPSGWSAWNAKKSGATSATPAAASKSSKAATPKPIDIFTGGPSKLSPKQNKALTGALGSPISNDYFHVKKGKKELTPAGQSHVKFLNSAYSMLGKHADSLSNKLSDNAYTDNPPAKDKKILGQIDKLNTQINQVAKRRSEVYKKLKE